ncbi:AraC family ligand binding domain-containing protein [Paenibacillus sp. CC-CFT747]|nr:AraC family ligand binding domain-containing protein [Paenibacillus sp. CC-CFT747]
MEQPIGLNELTVHLHLAMEKPTFPGWSDIRRTVGCHSFYWIHRGKGVFHAEGTRHQVTAGSLIYLKPGKELFMETDPREPLQMTMLLTEWATVRFGSGGWAEAEPVMEFALPFIRRYSPERASGIARLFRETLEGWVPGQTGGELPARARMLQLLYVLYRKEHEEEEKEPARAAFRQFKEYLDTHYSSSIRLKEAAGRFGISLPMSASFS